MQNRMPQAELILSRPEIQTVAASRSAFSSARQILIFPCRSRSIGVMGLVVKHHDRRTVIEVSQNPSGKCIRALLALVHHDIALASLAVGGFGRKLVPVGHQHLSRIDKRPELRRHEIELIVIGALLAVRPKHLQPFLDGEIRAHHQRSVISLRVNGNCSARTRSRSPAPR